MFDDLFHFEWMITPFIVYLIRFKMLRYEMPRELAIATSLHVNHHSINQILFWPHYNWSVQITCFIRTELNYYSDSFIVVLSYWLIEERRREFTECQTVTYAMDDGIIHDIIIRQKFTIGNINVVVRCSFIIIIKTIIIMMALT